jgi:hypothetical protein
VDDAIPYRPSLGDPRESHGLVVLGEISQEGRRWVGMKYGYQKIVSMEAFLFGSNEIAIPENVEKSSLAQVLVKATSPPSDVELHLFFYELESSPFEMSALGYPTWACQTLGISHPNGNRRTGVLVIEGAGLKTKFLIAPSWSVTGDNAIQCVLNLIERLEKQ